MLSLFISTIVFFVAVWYLNRYLNEQGMPRSMTRGMLVLMLAYLVSWGSGALVNWAKGRIEGPPPASQTSEDLSRLLKEIGRPQP